MTRTSRIMVVLAGTFVLTLSGGPSALILTGSIPGGDDGGASGADALTRASATALAATGGGRVTATELGDGETYYEVEVTRADGSHIDVQLDESFAVVGFEDDAGDSRTSED